MAIYNTTITVTEPQALVASENPIIVSLSTDENINEAYSKAYFRIDDFPTDGFSISFNLINPDYQITYYARDYPLGENFFTDVIKNATGGTVYTGVTTSDVANSLAEVLQNDPIISKYYHINYDAGIRVYLVAKEASSKYSLSGRITISNSTLVKLFNVSNGSAQFSGTDIANYSLYVDLYEITGNYRGTLNQGNLITSLSLPFSNDNIHRFDLSSICKTYVSTERPNFEVGGYTRLENYLKHFQGFYGEQYPLYEGSSIKKKFQRGSTSVFIAGNFASDYTNSNDFEYLTGTTLSSKIYDVPFLTNSPTVKQSYRTQKEGLYFIIPENIGTSLKLYANFTFWDGTVSNNVFLQDFLTSSSNSGGTYFSNCGYEILSFDSLETSTKKIKEVEYYVNQSTVATELFTNNSFASNLNNWNYTSPGNFAEWFWSGGSANSNLGSGTSFQYFTGWTFTTTSEGWLNGGALGGGTWAWNSAHGGSMKATTNNLLGVRNLVLSGITTPTEPFNINIQSTSTFFFDSTDLAGNIVFKNSTGGTIFSEQFSSWGSFSSPPEINITDSAVYNNIASAEIQITSTDFDAGDDIWITDITISVLSGATENYRTNNLIKTGLSPLSYTHAISANATFAGGTGNKLMMNIKDINGNLLGSSPYTLINQDTGTFTGSTQLSNVISPNIYTTEFWISGQTEIQQNVKINELSFKPVVESNLYSDTKIHKYNYEDPEDIFQVAFLSNWGVYETFCFVGEISEPYERVNKTYSVPVTPNDNGSYTSGFKNSANYGTEVTRKISANSGLLDFEHYTWLKELISSNDIFELREDGSINYLLITNVKYESSNQDNLYSFEIEFRQSIFENNISV